jgi:hypothetical protein
MWKERSLNLKFVFYPPIFVSLAGFWMVSIVYDAFYPMLRKLGGSWGYLKMILPHKVEQSALKRLLFSFLFPTQKLFQFSMMVPDEIRESCAIVQDVNVASEYLPTLFEFLESRVRAYPIWLCPLRHLSRPQRLFVAPETEHRWFLNVGIYGMPRVQPFSYLEVNRGLEQVVYERCGGRKGLYAHVYMRENEFWSYYDRPAYDRVRLKYGANGAFMDLHKKVGSMAASVEQTMSETQKTKKQK